MWLQHFEDFVVGHFCNRGRDILVACRAYMDGARVGSVVKGGVKDVNMDDKSYSQRFKNSVAVMLILLSRYFTEIGAADSKKFLLPVLPATAMKVKKHKAVQDVSAGYRNHQRKVCDIKYVLVADS